MVGLHLGAKLRRFTGRPLRLYRISCAEHHLEAPERQVPVVDRLWSWLCRRDSDAGM